MKRFHHILLSFLFITLLAGCDGHSESASTHSSHGHGHEDEDGHFHGGGEGSEVSLTQAQMDAVGIRLGGLERRDMSETVNATGVLEINSRDEVSVVTRIAGRVVSLNVVEGQSVKKGDVVAMIDSPEILLMYQQYQDALRESEAAVMEKDRQEALASQGAGIRKNLDNARLAVSTANMKVEQVRQRMEAYGVAAEALGGKSIFPVTADMDGITVDIQTSTGSYADGLSPMMKIVNTQDIFCMLALPEKDIVSIKEGMEVEMQLTTNPEVRFRGVVEDVTPILDRATRTVPVRVAISDTNVAMIPGMAVTGRISVSGNSEDVLPEEAVVYSGGKSYVFVLEDSHTAPGQTEYHFEKCEVACGTPSSGYVAVTPLVPIGEDAKIVTKGAFYLNSMMADHGEHNH